MATEAPADLSADIVIVGAGVAGLLVAWQLAKAGAKVVVLESGPSVDRGKAVETFRAAVAKTPESAYPDVPYAPRPLTVNPNNYYVQDGPDPFKATYERRVGGTTWHWLGTALRLLPNDFRMKSAYGVGVDWPISYAELEPWYAKAEVALGVSGDGKANLGGAPRATPYPLPPIPPTYLDEQIRTAVAHLGYVVAPTPQARNSKAYQNRPACCGNASCIPVCPIGAKYDAGVHAQLATAAGARIVEQAIVFALDLDARGDVSAVRFKHPDGTVHRAIGKVFVIAAHAIETPKLLLLSRSAARPAGVANSSGQVGRNLADHPTQLSWALAKRPLYPYRGPLSTSGIENLRDGSFRRQRSAFRVEIGNDGWSWPFGWPTDSAKVLIDRGLTGAELQAALSDRMAREFRVASLNEQLPDPDNRIVPAWEQLDAIGIPVPRISYRVDRYAQDGMTGARAVHDRIFDAVGVTFRAHADVFQSAGHIIGTYRMGSDRKTSVVDTNSRAHDHANLYLLGSGVFPTTGTANPTLTIAALALRAAVAVQQRLKETA
ncbi:MAG: GMC family oxidoreductase [Candidatus Baltobacteraceae bacterium]